jgi:hypothetical protein
MLICGILAVIGGIIIGLRITKNYKGGNSNPRD